MVACLGFVRASKESDMSDPLLPSSLEDRLEKIETALAHLQHDIDSLNASLMNHFRRLQEYELRFGRIEGELEMQSESTEKRDPGHERPPHY
jgi:uncharacterized coiled-coil protein SlyX